MAYYGERPHEEVQSQFNQDLRRVLLYDKKPSLILQAPLLGFGFISGLLADEELSSKLENPPMLSFVFEEGKLKPARVVIKDFEVKVSVFEPKPSESKPTKTQRRKK